MHIKGSMLLIADEEEYKIEINTGTKDFASNSKVVKKAANKHGQNNKLHQSLKEDLWTILDENGKTQVESVSYAEKRKNEIKSRLF
jgi:hypothetical protein